jgi:hypothetical protein
LSTSPIGLVYNNFSGSTYPNNVSQWTTDGGTSYGVVLQCVTSGGSSSWSVSVNGMAGTVTSVSYAPFTMTFTIPLGGTGCPGTGTATFTVSEKLAGFTVPGWYCVTTAGGTCTGTTLVELLDTDACNTNIKICGGPYPSGHSCP